MGQRRPTKCLLFDSLLKNILHRGRIPLPDPCGGSVIGLTPFLTLRLKIDNPRPLLQPLHWPCKLRVNEGGEGPRPCLPSKQAFKGLQNPCHYPQNAGLALKRASQHFFSSFHLSFSPLHPFDPITTLIRGLRA